jgi:hypothetical protein
MQTFLPDEEFDICAKILDYKRLGKQRVEACQIINTIERMKKGITCGWSNHPAVRMWLNHEKLLKVYANIMIEEWIKRGYKNNLKVYEIDYDKYIIEPFWLGDERLHSSHRANLLRKFPEHYSRFNWSEKPSLKYWWPYIKHNGQWKSQFFDERIKTHGDNDGRNESYDPNRSYEGIGAH